MMPGLFDGKVAIVTGGSKGIGKATARAVAAEGGAVVIAARGEEALAAAAREIEEATGRPVLPVRADMAAPNDIERLVEAAAGRFGRIDLLVNNAGAAPRGGPLDLSDDDFVGAIDSKLLGYVRAARAVVPHMRAAGGGVIISIGGMAALSPGGVGAATGIVNSAITNFMKGLADAVAPEGIRVVTLSPGAIMTDRWRAMQSQMARDGGIAEEEAAKKIAANIPVRFIAGPEAIADLVVFLASDRARYITGTNVVVDGGMNRYAF